MDINSIVNISPDLLYSKIGEEVVMMTIESGKYFKINDVGSDIWEMIKEPISVISLCDKLMEEFEITEEECYADVVKFPQMVEVSSHSGQV